MTPPIGDVGVSAPPPTSPVGIASPVSISSVGLTWNRCASILQLCNTIAVLVLSCFIMYLCLQIQLLSYKLTEEELEIEELKIQVQEKQQGQIQELNQAVEEEHNLTVNALAGTFTLLTCLITMFHMSSHVRNFSEPTVQRKVVAILWMSPIYSVTSFISLLVPGVEGYLAIIKDFYESYCIYTFLSFLVAVLGRGDRTAVVEVLSKHARHLQKPTRLLRRWYHPPPETNDHAMANAVLLECQLLAMQFVFIRPFTSLCNFVVSTLEDSIHEEEQSLFRSSTTEGIAMDTDVLTNSTSANMNMEDDSFAAGTRAYFTSPSFFFAMVTNISVFFAFTGLLKFYHATQQDLQWCQPWPKFLTIKGVVFLTFWQGLVISIVVNLRSQAGKNTSGIDPRDRASQLQNVLICLEMLLFSITHWCVFPAEEWEKDYQPKQVAKPGIGLVDFVEDIGEIYKSGRGKHNTNLATAQATNERNHYHHRGPIKRRGGGDGRGLYRDTEAAMSNSYSSFSPSNSFDTESIMLNDDGQPSDEIVNSSNDQTQTQQEQQHQQQRHIVVLHDSSLDGYKLS